MEGFEEKIGSVLNNPALMQQIMAMAQSLGAQQEEKEPAPAPEMPSIDPAALQKIMALASQSGIDRNQQALLAALKPYLTEQRIKKLEKAMRSSKLASLASSALGSGALSFLTGG